MGLKLDHVVIAVHDLERSIADYTALGFHVLRGGDHPSRVTHNALIVFADGVYFELIAFREPAPGERWWQLLHKHGEGIVDFALLPQDTADTVAQAAARGLILEGPLDGGRLRPDGTRLHWQTARPPSSDLPFLCGDLTPRTLRVPEGDARLHPNGALGVASLAVGTRDLDATLARWRALLGSRSDRSDAQAESQQEDANRIGIGFPVPAGDERIAVVQLGDSAIVLMSPRDDTNEQSSPLAQRLALRGEGPYALVLRFQDVSHSARGLDPALTHGALLEWDVGPAASA
ncbi:VOC family protein [Variovorax ginsengisoli]|nr:VOC family protein [Variovorax ginsengisoli]